MSISPGTHVVYTIRFGDTLYDIANRFGTSVEAIVRMNALYPPITEPDLIRPGQKLLIRVPGMSQTSAVQHQVTEGDTMYGLSQRYSVGLDMLAALNRMERPDILRVAQLVYIPAFVYEVEEGDSLYRIARRFGTTMGELVSANRNRIGFSPDLIYPGFRFVVPLPSSANVVVFQPLPGTRLTPGMTLAGAARAFEAALLYQIRDAADQIVTRERAFTASEGAPAFGTFQVPVAFERKPSTASGTLMVYTRSARDGSVQDLVEVAVTF